MIQMLDAETNLNSFEDKNWRRSNEANEWYLYLILPLIRKSEKYTRLTLQQQHQNVQQPLLCSHS